MNSIFDDILVAINYTFPHYDSIEFLRQLYAFPKVAFYGPLDPKDSRVIPCDTHHGYFAYRIFHDAFARFDVGGVMVVHDDFLLNRSNFESLNSEKVWSQPWQRKPLDKWHWWRTPFGAPAIAAVEGTLDRTFDNIVFGFSDLMYISRVATLKLLPLLSVFSDHEVFVELAWPNLVNTYVGVDERAFLNTINHVWYEYGHDEWQRLYGRDLHGIHPVKWSKPSNQLDAIRFIGGTEGCEGTGFSRQQ